ncbi:hypothetical protein C9374_000832 [Naegleria lovaniensis]|uniref:Spindle assembly abnormal protein 6 N-terminal domain-containing protein n=1 Tax=Naegleria lovaniensis TaxID=51637 RepID=A0AA88GSB6_NAELO|nr:uncharacterized protein C9374_000832 [Naegleria lovaniensis]KAG2387982.1 hypothetical protein C9374_000832 [Naegleria lovaniensis]
MSSFSTPKKPGMPSSTASLYSSSSASSVTGASPSTQGVQPSSSPGSGNVNTLLTGIDFKAIEDMDPSLAEGHRVIFDKEIPIELRTQDQNESESDLGTLEAIRVKILILEGEVEDDASVKLELTSEADLFFHFTHSMGRRDFLALQQSQKLMVDFPNYPKMLSKMLNACIKEPESFLCILIMERDGKGHLNFVQNMEYKFVELLSLEIQESPEHIIRQHISFRYNSMRSRVAILNARLQEVSTIIKMKNPSLLLHLTRTVAGTTQPNTTSPSAGSQKKK